MEIYSVLCPDGSFHLFSNENYAEKFAKYYKINYKEIIVDNKIDMTVVNNLCEWELYHFYHFADYECGDASDHLYVLAKTEDHAKNILRNHGIYTDEYCNYTVELSDIEPGTTLDCLYNFDKKE